MEIQSQRPRQKCAADLIGRPLALASFAEYQDGAVVSREILRKGTGTVTFFAFDAGQGLSEHTAPFDAPVQVVEGKAEITIGGQLHTVPAGHFVIMPANVPHAVHAPGRFQMLLTMIRA